ncbi:hypothetical protein GOP47_0022660 [Adiantum capillus-veneris]|uniref:Uncharacterized protein n=1 Tax=Adiantum capillus-veneris TaxID=13818 RepID=A0A9D4U5T8_ADICA|nr:hypothetical protein GOP47_0022660 [Adiantum capillus-veneris]
MGQAGHQYYARGRRPIPYPIHLHNFRDNGSIIAGDDDSVDKLLYHNLVEMIPLVESFMQDQQTTKSFPRHASLVYTPTPSREAWPFKKPVDHSNRGKPGRGQLVSSKRVELRESSLWDNTENMLHDDHIYAEEIPLLPYPSNQRANRAGAPTLETIQLRRQVQQLEQKLSEKECQLQAAEKTAQQIHLQLNATVERLQSQIQQKDQAIQNVQNQLFERQLEVVSLQSLVKKSEVNVQASSMKAASLEEELGGLRNQVGTLLFLVQSQISGLVEDGVVETPPEGAESPPAIEEIVVEEPISSTESDLPAMVDRHADDMHSHDIDGVEEEHIEEIRKKYVAALIDARENPSDEMLSLVVELRMQLHALVMCPPMMTISATMDEMCWQPLGIAIC